MSKRPARSTGRPTGRDTKRPAQAGRFSLLLVAFWALLLLVGGRLAYVQLVVGPAYAAAAADQRTRDIALSPSRGFIFDRDGEVLAESVDARTIYAVPRSITDKEATARAIAETIGGDPATYLERLERDTAFVYIARKVDSGRAAALKELGIAGLGFTEDWRRTYPSNELACQVLGFVGVDDAGLGGLELFYDDLLAGEPGRLVAERDTRGRPIPGGITLEEDAVDGSDLVLTIDRDIQYQAQLALSEAVTRWGAAAGSVIVMDPRTGEILANASVPAYDPNRYAEADPASHRNRAITDTYEPGSTIKSMTAAAVIERGLFSPESMFDLPPTIMVGGRTIHEAHDRPAMTWSLTQIVTNSSNVGSVKLGMALGAEGLYESFAAFGLTEKTGVDFPGEVTGYLPPTDRWSSSSIATIPFGQGISMTPLQLARALAVIANGGDLVTPHFLKDVRGASDEVPDWPKRRALSTETAQTMRRVLTDVVYEGTGAAAAVPGYQVAGKTGTAQKVRTDGQPGYAKGKYVASFSGFLPADDPRVLIVVTVDEPSGSIYGGTVAAPAFSRIASFCVEHLKIPPGDAVTGTSQ